MNLSAWLAYLEEIHPEEIELGLDRVERVASELALDFSSKTVVSIAGTNGKGSTSCFLSNLLQTAGKTVGLYSSPHLLKYNERIRINGVNIEDSVLCQAFSRIEQVRKETKLTYFEFGTLAALLIFAESDLDYIILEVGLGGRLDAVNIIDADLALITNIALDHTEWLGDTREEIAFEKAGILRQGKTVIFGESDMPESLQKQISSKQAKLYQYTKDFDSYILAGYWHWKGKAGSERPVSYEISISQESLLDKFPSNAATALQATLLLNVDISESLVEQALSQTALAGRFQIIDRAYTLVLDVAHNPDAANYLAKNMQRCFANQKIHILLAVLSNKDYQNIVANLDGIACSWYIASIKNSRGSEAKMLYNELQDAAQNSISMFDSVREAFHAAEQNMQPNEVLLVTGSFYTVADVLELI